MQMSRICTRAPQASPKHAGRSRSRKVWISIGSQQPGHTNGAKDTQYGYHQTTERRMHRTDQTRIKACTELRTKLLDSAYSWRVAWGVAGRLSGRQRVGYDAVQ